MESDNESGSAVSTSSISLENLPSTLPCGITSKKLRGAFNMARNMVKCNTRAAYQQPSRGAKSVKAAPNAENVKRLWVRLTFYLNAFKVPWYLRY
ncbi:hypothetical protein Trydic_g15899 [Trypoxylus dichotomus]